MATNHEIRRMNYVGASPEDRGLIRVEVDDEHGTVAQIIGVPGPSPRDRAELDALAGRLASDMATLLCTSEQQARVALITELTRLVADEAAYERVAVRRGVLPL